MHQSAFSYRQLHRIRSYLPQLYNVYTYSTRTNFPFYCSLTRMPANSFSPVTLQHLILFLLLVLVMYTRTPGWSAFVKGQYFCIRSGTTAAGHTPVVHLISCEVLALIITEQSDVWSVARKTLFDDNLQVEAACRVLTIEISGKKKNEETNWQRTT